MGQSTIELNTKRYGIDCSIQMDLRANVSSAVVIIVSHVSTEATSATNFPTGSQIAVTCCIEKHQQIHPSM